MNALWNTAWVMVLAGGLAWVAGLAWVLAWLGMGRRGRTLWVGAAVATLAMPSFLVANVWLELSAGWRLEWGGERSATAMLPWAALVLASLTWPLPALLALGGGGRVSGELLDAMPGLRGWALMRWVAWPAAAGGLGTGAVLAMAMAASNFAIPTLFQVRVLPELIWVRFNSELDVGAAWRAGLPLLGMSAAALGLARGRAGTWTWSGSGSRSEASVWRGRMGGWWWAGVLASMGVIGVSVVLPLARLVFAERTWSEWVPAMRAGAGALGTSAGMALGVTLACSAAGLGLASWRGATRWRALAWVAFLVPGILWATPWVPWLARPSMRALADTAWVPWGLMTLRYVALGWTASALALAASDRTAWEALRVCGAGRWEAWRRALWPQVRPAWAGAATATFVLTLWDVETVVLVMPPGMETAALRVFNLLHYGHSGQVNALCLALIMLALATVAAGGWLMRAGPAGGRILGWVGLAWMACAGLTGCSDEGKASRMAVESVVFEAAEVIGGRGVGPGQFNKPRSLACDREDNLYVADVTGRIQKFDREGRFLRQWQMPVTDLGKPKGMGLDPEGRVLVVEPHYMRVNHFDGEGRLSLQWGTRGTNAGSFILPRSVAVNSRGEYFLSEYTVVDRVQRFDPRREGGAPAFALAWGEPGDKPGQFNRAEGIAVGPDDTVYVADSCNHRVQVFDREGKFLRQQGRAGSNPGEFSYPYDVRVDDSGLQYVCEFGNSRVTVLDAAGGLVEVVGGPGAAPGRFANPWSVALDSRGNLYVADSQNHRVQKLVRRRGKGAGR